MVYRIYVAKKSEFANEAKALMSEIKNLLKIEQIEDLKVINRYDVENIEKELFDSSINAVFSEPQIDDAFEKLPKADFIFAVEPLPGQFDQRADSAAQCIQLFSAGNRPVVKTAKVYDINGRELSHTENALFISANISLEFSYPKRVFILSQPFSYGQVSCI